MAQKCYVLPEKLATPWPYRFAQASTLSHPLLPFKPLRGKMQPVVD